MIGVIGDPHLRDGDDIISRFRLFSFEKAFEIVRNKKVDNIIILGDLFDKPCQNPGFVSKVRNIILGDNPIRTFILNGNHDMRYLVGSALWYVIDSEWVHAITEVYLDFTVIDGCLFIPYISESNAKDIIEYALNKYGSDQCCIFGHFGVYGVNDAPWMKNDRWFVNIDWLIEKMNRHGIINCIVGHRHDFFENDSPFHIVGLGSLSPCSVAEDGFNFGNLAFYNSKVREFVTNINCVSGIRYGNEHNGLGMPRMRIVPNDCIVHTVINSVVYVEYEGVEDLNQLLGKRILLERGVSNSKENVDIDLDDPSCKASIDAAIQQYIEGMSIEEKEDLRIEALSLLHSGELPIEEKKGGRLLIEMQKVIGNTFYGIARARKYT